MKRTAALILPILLILAAAPLPCPQGAVAAAEAAEEKPFVAEPGFTSHAIGNLKIIRLLDRESGIPSQFLRGDIKAFAHILPTGACAGASAAYLIDDGHEVILINAGAGETAQGARLMQNLRGAGYRPEQVARIFLTHLHRDTAGGLILNHAPAFPGAELLIPEAELAFWKDRSNAARVSPLLVETFDTVEELARLYEKKIRTFGPEEDVIGLLRPVPAFGHSAGHTMFELGLPRMPHILFWDGIMHCLKVQTPLPRTTVIHDTDPAEAIRAREQALIRASNGRMPVFGAHFPSPGVALFTRDDQTQQYSWQFVDPAELAAESKRRKRNAMDVGIEERPSYGENADVALPSLEGMEGQ